MNTLVDGVTYLVTSDGSDAGGLYHGDTRYLLPITASLADETLTVLGEDRHSPARRTRRYANVGATVNEISQTVTTKHATVVATRHQRVREGRFVEAFELANHTPQARSFEVTLAFDTDFSDIFEVRDLCEPRSRDVRAEVTDGTVTYTYEYADDADETVALETAVRFDPDPATLAAGRATFAPTLDPQDRATVTVEVVPGGDESTVRAVDGTAASSGTGADEERSEEERRVDPFVVTDPIETGTPAYDRAFAVARRDVRALTTRTEQGPVPLAGAPWFVTVFGRDALLASYLLLPVAPALATGTLQYLAAHQGLRQDDDREEMPGKIFHEIRRGELARTGVVPHTPYYGSIDATPLWVTLLHETWRWTGEDDLVVDLWETLRGAVARLQRAVGSVGDNPFLYYRQFGSTGVVHKVWRDSANGVQYADGSRADPPLAGAAVQGYLYDALTRAADLAGTVRDDDDLATDLRERADELAAAFDAAFWMPDRDFYAAAVTADERRVDSVTSAAGHCLWSGIVPDDRAGRVVDRLLADDLSSGWGLRTLSAAEDGYSPVSYHAGGVWPHDTAVAALGLARYDRHEAAATVATNQLDAFSQLGDRSVPELFCGFDDAAPPVPYASACRPQAWSAAAPFGLLRALFDLDPDSIADPTVRSDAVAPTAVEPLAAYWREQ